MFRLGGRKQLPLALGNALFGGRSTASRFLASVPGVDIHSESTKRLTVAIVGRPNTGKSTLFNRLTKTKMAIVSNVPGTTRDRREGQGFIAGLPLNLIDTGGLDDRGAVSISIQTQVAKAFEYSDVVLFMLDGKAGVTALDLHFAQWIRKTLSHKDKDSSKKILLVANKTEGAHMSERVMETVADAMSLGFGEPILISASHGDGLADLAQELIQVASARGKETEVLSKADKRKLFKKLSQPARGAVAGTGDAIESALEAEDSAVAPKTESNKIPVEDRIIQLAIMGRPNVGKSTLLNAFVREERSIAGPMAGLTRDAVHVEWAHRERQFKLVDTAGLTRIRTNKQLLEGVKERRQTAQVEKIGLGVMPVASHTKGLSNSDVTVKLPGRDLADPDMDPSQYSYQISEYALISALNALRFAQVVLLVVEGTQGKFSKLDLQLARKCLEEGRGLVIAANKSDIMDDRGVSGKVYEEGVKEHIEECMREFGDVPVVVSSGTENRGIDRLLNTVIEVHDAWSKRIETGTLNAWMRDLLITQPPPRVDGKSLNLKYMTQVKTRPPTFALFTNLEELPVFFERYLKSNIQTAFNLQGVPIRFVVRKTKGVDIHRNKKLNAKGKTEEAGARSARAPSGLGTWKSLAKGGSVKKGLVGPNRNVAYMRRRISGILRHKRKSEAGKGLVQFSGLQGIKGGFSKKNADSATAPKRKGSGLKNTTRRTGRKKQKASKAAGDNGVAESRHNTGSSITRTSKAGTPVKRRSRASEKAAGSVNKAKPKDKKSSGEGERRKPSRRKSTARK